MASSQGVNVLRWSALGFGVLYGFYHQRSVTSQAQFAKTDREYKHQESLIAKAKAEFVKKSLPPENKSAGGGIITDPMDPKFDLEAYLQIREADTA
ncbi:MAG: hypothetical protein Q9227_004198 [Pyrenula ochraceoflavens]